MNKRSFCKLDNVCGRKGCNVHIRKSKRYCRDCLIDKFKLKSELQTKHKHPAVISQKLRNAGFLMELNNSYIEAIRREDDTWE